MTNTKKNSYHASASDFHKIPGSPLAYWLSPPLRRIFEVHQKLSQIALPKEGLNTTNNDKFLKRWFEVGFHNTHFSATNREDALESGVKWFPCQKGGSYRKWYGNNEFVVNWDKDGEEIKSTVIKRYGSVTKRVVNEHLYFKQGITWSAVSTSLFAMRYIAGGHIFETAGSMCFFPTEEQLLKGLAVCNSCITPPLLECVSPTLSYKPGPVGMLPIAKNIPEKIVTLARNAINIAKNDWNAYETSWEFKRITICEPNYRKSTLKDTYFFTRFLWQENTIEMQRLEEENNYLIINTYELTEELNNNVPLNKITLLCNPYHRYSDTKSDDELEAMLQSDTIAELISYTIGCMMGRYSLDREGLVYAHEGNKGFAELVAEGAYKTFPADNDGILPLMDDEWFDDDVTSRVKEFVRTVWGEEHLQENLEFIAESLCLYAIKPKKGESALDTIRRYLSTQFWKDHLKMYKKRPIYWLFSSGKEKAFECLVYLHRYNDATLARMRTEYVVPLLARYQANIDRLNEQVDGASGGEATRLKRERDSLSKKFNELRSFDDRLRHYADMRISIDLDEGVKVNYGRFGDLLADVKAITGNAPEVI